MATPIRDTNRGDTWQLYFQVVQDIDTGRYYTTASHPRGPTLPGIPPPGSVPVNITGWKFWHTVKRHSLDPDLQAIWQGTSDGGQIIIVAAVVGRGTSTMPPQATVGFPDGDVALLYDLQIKDVAGNVFTIESSTVVVHPDVTRATV